MSRPPLYHFTCGHGAEQIREDGLIRPMSWFPAGSGMVAAPNVVWLTSDPLPSRDAVGLTSTLLTCDRMEYRFDVGAVGAWPWRSFASLHGCTDAYWRDLLGTSWGRPDTWYVATRPLEFAGWVRTEAVVA